MVSRTIADPTVTAPVDRGQRVQAEACDVRIPVQEGKASECERLQIGFDEVLETLGGSDDEFTGVCHQRVGGRFMSAVVPSAHASAVVYSLPDEANVWFSINPTTGPARDGGSRGSERDVTRWAALYLDVDVKEGAFQDLGKAEEFIDRVSELIGTRPSVVIHSGHGLQPLWAIEDGRLDTPDARDRACQLSRRFGRLAATVAEKYSASLDTVSDLARILRVPGTTNWKDTDYPVGACAQRDTGGPLSVERIEEFLDEWCPRIDSDTPALGEMVSSPSDWQFGSGTCAYVAKMVTAWRADRPRDGRHQWLMDRCVRLEAAHRLGCITEVDRDAALRSVEEALRHWCQVLDPSREVQPGEVGGGFRWAVQRVSTMTDTEARAQLGCHRHDDEENLEDLFEEFWNSRPYLSTIRQFAYARMTSPWGGARCGVLPGADHDPAECGAAAVDRQPGVGEPLARPRRSSRVRKGLVRRGGR